MADVSHELGALRFVVDSPLSSKVAMFNNQAQTHQNNQLLNPFSGGDGRSSPKPQFAKDQYGKPLAGSLTEMRGNKANIHVMKEMLELCQVINSEGYEVKDEPTMRVIPFGELFNIYNYISDKVVGLLLRARKHKIVAFEGEMLFQRRDDNVPIFLLKPIKEIREELEVKIEEFKRASSPAPQATSVLMDKSANEQRLKDLQDGKLGLPQKRSMKSRTPSPSPLASRSATPVGRANAALKSPCPSPTPDIIVLATEKLAEIKPETTIEAPVADSAATTSNQAAIPTVEVAASAPQAVEAVAEATDNVSALSLEVTQTTPEIVIDEPTKATEPQQTTDTAIAEPQILEASEAVVENKIDVNNNSDVGAAKIVEPPTNVVNEATATVTAEVPLESNVVSEVNDIAANCPPDVKAGNISA